MNSKTIAMHQLRKVETQDLTSRRVRRETFRHTASAVPLLLSSTYKDGGLCPPPSRIVAADIPKEIVRSHTSSKYEDNGTRGVKDIYEENMDENGMNEDLTTNRGGLQQD